MVLQLVITDAGRAALVDQASGGLRAVRVTAVGVSPVALAATPGGRALPGEVVRLGAVAGEATAPDTFHLTVTIESDASYTVRSLALYLDDGTVFALYGQAEAIVEKSPHALLLLALDVALVDVPAAQITFGSANFLNPLATTQRAGVVRLAGAAEAVALADARLALTPATLEQVFRTGRVFADRGIVTAAALDTATLDGAWSVEQAGYSDTLLAFDRPSSTGAVQLLFGYQGGLTWRNRTNNLRWNAFNTIWHSANDGAGSGCDADLVDGWHADELRRWANLLDRPVSFPPSAHGHAREDLAGAFPGTLAGNGYVLLPDGLIVQWVTGAQQGAGSTAAQTITLPVAFPTRCLQVSVTTQLAEAAGDTRAAYFFVNPSLTSVTVVRQLLAGADGDQRASWPVALALGC